MQLGPSQPASPGSVCTACADVAFCGGMSASTRLVGTEGGNMGRMLDEEALSKRQAAGWDVAIAIVSVTQVLTVHTMRSAVPAICTLLCCAISLPDRWQLHW